MQTDEPVVSNKKINVALTGNPNTGKTSLFNALTGLNQKVGNFPGVTVDKKVGKFKTPEGSTVTITDLPGTYSLNPKAEDEKITCNYIENSPEDEIIIVIVDGTNLKRGLLLCTQLIDKKKPVILAINMMDLVQRNGITIDIPKMKKELGIDIVPINARLSKGITGLKKALENFQFNENNVFFSSEANFDNDDTYERYKKISAVVAKTVTTNKDIKRKNYSKKADNILTHKVWGFLIFIAIIFLVFQAIFSWAQYPMDGIEWGFMKLGQFVSEILPAGILNDLIVNGIIAGISGIAVFIPQIVLLFLFLDILEDSGYMARVSFILDKIMRPIGLTGRSVIPLLSGAACAVPAIMSTRTISDVKERMITIFVTPLIACSARIPVYVLLISLLVPHNEMVLGIFNLQGIVMMFMYFLGFIAAIGTAFLMKIIFKPGHKKTFLMEIPVYRAPRWHSIFIDMYGKIKVFLFKVGKIVIAISIVLWVLSTYGPPKKMKQIKKHYAELIQENPTQKVTLQSQYATAKLDNSFAGIMGKTIEPVIRPLGFDWKIGISLITSFAAREAFVGTMATLYSVDNTNNTTTIKQRMAASINPATGKKVYTPAAIFALMIFYAFAMQCMSTLATVKRETASWKWPIAQMLYMGALAYFAAMIVFQVLS